MKEQPIITVGIRTLDIEFPNYSVLFFQVPTNTTRQSWLIPGIIMTEWIRYKQPNQHDQGWVSV